MLWPPAKLTLLMTRHEIQKSHFHLCLTCRRNFLIPQVVLSTVQLPLLAFSFGPLLLPLGLVPRKKAMIRKNT